MQVIEFIKEHGLNALAEQLGISVKLYDDRIVLNYNQIESPKTHPIVMECRGLILDKDFNVLCRPMDRFFNLGEALNVMPEIDWGKAVIFEKVDGSLIKIYKAFGRWEIATRGTAFAESDCMGFSITFRELVLKALGSRHGNGEPFSEAEFQRMCDYHLDPELTYLCELTCVENRVVRRYEGYTIHYLCARKTNTGEYVNGMDGMYELGAESIKMYHLQSTEEALEAARQLKNLDEGFIVYQNGVPICKIKSPAYVAVHHIRGEGLNPKRISQLVISGEEEEYLTYFPEDRPVIEPYVRGYETLHDSMCDVMELYCHFQDQKEFAKRIASFPFKAVLFNARAKGISVNDSFHQQRDGAKIDLLRKYVV